MIMQEILWVSASQVIIIFFLCVDFRTRTPSVVCFHTFDSLPILSCAKHTERDVGVSAYEQWWGFGNNEHGRPIHPKALNGKIFWDTPEWYDFVPSQTDIFFREILRILVTFLFIFGIFLEHF